MADHKRTLILKRKQRNELIRYRDHDPRPYVRERAGALRKIAEGESPHAVALKGLLKPRDPDTVYGWLNLYEAEGVVGLVQHQHGGFHGTSLEAHRNEVQEQLHHPPNALIDRLAHKIYVIQDNWNVHAHPEVQAALARLPRFEIVTLPTYAPWLNPIEKLWRWVRQRVLHRHRLSDRWVELQGHVAAFLDQFGHGSRELLRYIGLLGNGQFAQALRADYPT